MGALLPELQANAAECLGNLSHQNPTNQATIARTGAIGPLCTLLREGSDEQVKTRAAGALWALTIDNKPNKDTVTKMGGVEPLVSLIVGGATDASLEQAIQALACLCFKHSENRENIAKLIVTRMANRSQLTQQAGGAERVLWAVSKMCKGQATIQAAIAKAGGVPPLIVWLSGGGGDASPEAQAAAATALLSMVAGNEMLQSLIAQSNGIPPLIELVSKGSTETQAAAARLLWHLAGNEAAGEAICAAGGMAPLCETMLRSADAHAQELAATVISRLLKSHSKVGRSFEQRHVPSLVQLLDAGSPAGQQQAACALGELARIASKRGTLAAAGGIEALIRLLTSPVVGTPEMAARVLSLLAREGDEAPPPDEGGSGGGRAGTGGTGSGRGAEAPPHEDGTTPRDLALSTGLGAALVAEDGPWESEDDHAGGVPSADAALLASASERRQRIVHGGGVRQLTTMLSAVSLGSDFVARKMWELVARVIGANPETGGDQAALGFGLIGVQEQAAASLADLAGEDAAMQKALIDEGCVPLMLGLIRSGSQTSQEHAARAIFQLCTAPDNRTRTIPPCAETGLP